MAWETATAWDTLGYARGGTSPRGALQVRHPPQAALQVVVPELSYRQGPAKALRR